MSQLYLATVTIDLGGHVEETKLCVAASNAEQASTAACIHCQVAPSMATVETKRIKGNIYGFEQKTRAKQKPPAIAPTDNGGRTVQQIEEVVRSIDHRPELIKRAVELRATIFSRTDGAACVGVGKGLEAYGRTGRWDTSFVQLEDLNVLEAEITRPSNPRFLENGQYTHTRVFRG